MIPNIRYFDGYFSQIQGTPEEVAQKLNDPKISLHEKLGALNWIGVKFPVMRACSTLWNDTEKGAVIRDVFRAIFEGRYEVSSCCGCSNRDIRISSINTGLRQISNSYGYYINSLAFMPSIQINEVEKPEEKKEPSHAEEGRIESPEPKKVEEEPKQAAVHQEQVVEEKKEPSHAEEARVESPEPKKASQPSKKPRRKKSPTLQEEAAQFLKGSLQARRRK